MIINCVHISFYLIILLEEINTIIVYKLTFKFTGKYVSMSNYFYLN